MMALRAYRVVFASGVVAFGVSVLAGLGFGLVAEGGLPPVRDEGAPSLSLEEQRVQATLQPRNAVVLGRVAAALDRGGDPQGAILMYEATLRVNPMASWVHGPLASLYLRAGRIEEGRRQVRISMRRGIPVDEEVMGALGLRKGKR